MQRTGPILFIAVYLLVIVYFLFTYSTLTWDYTWAARLYPEGRIFETAGALMLLLAAAAGFWAFFLARRSGSKAPKPLGWVSLGLSLLFLLAAAQETGWGQPALSGTGAPELTGSAPAAPGLDVLFGFVVLGAAAGLPILYLLLPRLRQYTGRFIVSPYWPAATLFLFNHLFALFSGTSLKPYYHYKLFRFPQAVQAVKESNYELACLFLALVLLWEVAQAYRRDQKTI